MKRLLTAGVIAALVILMGCDIDRAALMLPDAPPIEDVQVMHVDIVNHSPIRVEVFGNAVPVEGNRNVHNSCPRFGIGVPLKFGNAVPVEGNRNNILSRCKCMVSGFVWKRRPA